jgi:hypothetical protein
VPAFDPYATPGVLADPYPPPLAPPETGGGPPAGAYTPAASPGTTYPPPATAPAYPTPAPPPGVPRPGNGWYSVSTTITADWPLEGSTIEALVVEVEKLQAKILAADLPGERPTVKPAADAGESKEGTARSTAPVRPAVPSTPVPPPTVYLDTTPRYSTPPSNAPASPYGSTPPPSSGYSPAASYPAPRYCAPGMSCAVMPCGVMPSTITRFVCVAKPSDQQRKTALAEAFGKAKTQAAELVEAAGGKLGPVATLNRFVTYTPCSNPAPGYPSDYTPYATPVCFPSSAYGNDAVTSQPNETEFRIQIHVQFRIE